VDPEPTAEGSSVATGPEETTADDHVRPIGGDRLEQTGQLARVVLPISVDLDGDVEAVVARVLVAGLDCPADADVVRKARDESACALSLGLGTVRRPVVDDEDLEPWIDGTDLADHAGDRRRLVQSGDDGHATHGHEPIVTGCRQGLGDGPHKISDSTWLGTRPP